MSAPLRTLLVDDERLARKRLRSLLAAHPEVSVVGEAGNVAEAAALAARERPALIFLDVQMPPATGFDLLPLLEPAPAIVFVTAHDEFAVRAFAASAVDYLLKPVDPARLVLALQHVRLRLAAQPDEAPPPDERPAAARLAVDDSLVLRDSGRIRRVRLGEIAALVAEGDYTRVHLATDRSMLVLRRMAAWEALLPMPPFLRAHRSLLVNLERVAGLDIASRDAGQLTLDAFGAPTLELGRVALAQLRAALPA